MITLSSLTVLPEQQAKEPARLQAHIETLGTRDQHLQVTPRRLQLSAKWQVGANGHLSRRWRLSEMSRPKGV